MKRLTEEQTQELAEKFFEHDYYAVEDDVMFIDGHVSVDAILAAADWIHGLEDNKPFSMKWLHDNFDFEANDARDDNAEVYFEDIISDERGEAGHIDIIYCSQVFWTCGKGTAGDKWLCTCTTEWRSDDWIPCVVTIGDFKRLWRVATGYELPLKKGEPQ